MGVNRVSFIKIIKDYPKSSNEIAEAFGLNPETIRSYMTFYTDIGAVKHIDGMFHIQPLGIKILEEVSPEIQKICSKCGVSRLLDQFVKDSHLIGGYRSTCKQCEKNGRTQAILPVASDDISKKLDVLIEIQKKTFELFERMENKAGKKNV